MKLNVFLLDKFVGTLATTSNRGIVFQYDSHYLEHDTLPLSLSLPLSAEEYSQDECLPYFSGLLPEGSIRSQVSNYFHISETSIIKLLALLGGECSGTVTLFNNDEIDIESAKQKKLSSWKLTEDNYKVITEEEIAKHIRITGIKPLIVFDHNMKQTLAGAQTKVSLAYFDNKWHVPLNGAPSTHILKPAINNYEDLAANEFICMRLAENFGINVAPSFLSKFDGIPVYITKRYDRAIDFENNTIKRLHQEDFCQSLGIFDFNKYQADGGPSLLDSYNLIKTNCTNLIENTNQFVSILIFNYLIGNCDSHGKNFSLLFRKDKNPILSPFYDLVSTIIYPGLSDKMAMKIGGQYKFNKIFKDHILDQASLMGLSLKFFLNKIKSYKEKYLDAFSVIEGLEELKEYQSTIASIKNVFEEQLRKLQA